MATYVIIHGIGGYAGIYWQKWLHDELEKKGHTVLMSSLPESDHPNRQTWLKLVQQIITPLEHRKTIIIAHSLGVTTALDVIESLPEPIYSLISVSGFNSDYQDELNSYFLKAKSINFNKVKNNCIHFKVIYGDNDPFIPQRILLELAQNLGVKPTIILKGKHLDTDAGYKTFPKLLKEIDSIK